MNTLIVMFRIFIDTKKIIKITYNVLTNNEYRGIIQSQQRTTQQPIKRTSLPGLEIAQVLLVTINLKHSIERGNVHKKNQNQLKNSRL